MWLKIRNPLKPLAWVLFCSLLVACSRTSAEPTASPTPPAREQASSATATELRPTGTAAAIAPATQPAEPTPRPAETEAAYFPYKNPSSRPVDYAALIAQQVELGIWTPEQGLLTVLRSYAGDADAAAELALFPAPVRPELHRLFFEARQYIEAGAQAEVREELAGLMQTISPDAATLDAYSSPEDAQSARPPGLAARPDIQPSAVCQALAADGFPAGAATTCFLYSAFTLASKEYRVYYPASWGSGGGANAAQVQAAFVALSDAVTRYAPFGPQNGINVVFAIQDLPAAEGADPNLGGVGADAGQGDPCPVIVYPFGVSYDLAQLKFMLAHEVFHCFQWRHYGSLMGIDARDWWVEGGAEYFANLVYPSADFEHAERLAMFVSGSRFTPVVAMAYESYLFFMYLGMRDDFGPAGILALMGAMPASGGISEQAAALAGRPGMSQVWRDFARAFIDNKILDTSGKLIQTDFVPNQSLAILDDETFPLESDDFTLARYRVSLGPGQGYKIDVAQSDPSVQYDLRHMASPGAWGEFALDLPAGCAQYYGLLTSVGVQFTKGNSRQSTVEAQVEAPAITGGTCDQCIVGTWQLNNPSFLAAILASIEPSGFPIDVSTVTGSAQYTFDSAGAMGAQFSNLTYQFGGVQHNAPFGNDITYDTELILNGSDGGIYWTDGAGGLYLAAADFGVDYTMRTKLNGELVYEGPALEGMASSPAVAVKNAYACEGDQLTIWVLPETVYLGPLAYDRVP